MANLAVFNQTIRNPRTQEYLNDVLKDRKGSFVTSLVSVVTNNQQLQACDPQTIMYAALKATALDMPFDPNLGFAYVIPYKNKGKDEAQFQMGYKGFVQLAQRSGQFSCINADVVHEGELTGFNKLTGEIELNGTKTSDKVIGYFAHFALLNGFRKTLYMTTEEIRNHAQRFSQTAKKGFGLWSQKDSFDAMAKKTVLKMLLSKYAPLSVEMQSAIKADQTVIRGDKDSDMEYVDNQEDTSSSDQVDRLREKAEAMRQAAQDSVSAPCDTETGEVAEDMPEEIFDKQ